VSAPALGLDPLSAREAESFERNGFLVVRGVLDDAAVDELLAAVDVLRNGRATDGELVLDDFVSAHPAFVELVDHPAILGKVAGLLGENICLYHTQLIVKPPSGKGPRTTTFSFHQDSGQVNADLETDPRPRLSLKVAYYLTDVSMEGSGNTWVVPGSQFRNELELPPGESGQPAGAEPILARPGDALVFDRRVWHAGTRNWSELTRIVLFYGYGYRWLRPKDELRIGESAESFSDPIRRQLLGAGTPNGRYTAPDDEVPLRALLARRAPTSTVDRR
jgi:hypothetical protein